MYKKYRLYLYFIPFLLVLGFGLRHSLSYPPSDFAGYYYGGRALLNGQYQNAYGMQALNDQIAADGYKDVLVSYAPFPPFTSLVFSPFLLFPMHGAKILFDACCIALFLFSLFRTCRYFSTPPYLILALPFIFFMPLINNLAFGQAYLLLFVLLIEGYLAYRQGKPILSAALWGVAILFKLFPAFLFLFLLLRKKTKNFIYLTLACTLLLSVSLWLNGFSAWKFYISVMVPKMGRGELNDPFTYIFQSAYMLMKRTFRFDLLLNPHPILDNAYLFTLGMALFKAFILSTTILLTLREKDDFYSFSVWAAASMLISPNGSSYSLVLLLLPLLAFVYRAYPSPTPDTSPGTAPAASPHSTRASPWLIAAILTLTAACAVNVSRFGAFPIWAQFPRLYLLLLFYSLLLWKVRGFWNIGLFSGLTALFFALEIRGNLPEKDASSYFLPTDQHFWIFDYTARNNRLVYFYRDEAGRHEQTTDYPVLSLTEDGVSLRDNQIWYKGKRLTDSPDHKEKPGLLNGEYILYISDKNRGVDFSTLRKLRPDEKTTDAPAIPVSSR